MQTSPSDRLPAQLPDQLQDQPPEQFQEQMSERRPKELPGRLTETLLENVLLLRINQDGVVRLADISIGRGDLQRVQAARSTERAYPAGSQAHNVEVGLRLEEAFPTWRGSALWPALALVRDGVDGQCAVFSWQSNDRPQRQFSGSAQKWGNEMIFCFMDTTEQMEVQAALTDRSEQLVVMKSALEDTRHALHQAKTRLQILSQTDALTGLSNRRHFLDQARAELRKATRYGTDLGLIVLDIDDLASINSRFGVPCGDQVITAVTEVLRASCRLDVDLPARLGGEEFAVLLPFTGLHAAAALAGRFQQRIAALAIPVGPALFPDDPDRQTVAITASFGVASARRSDPSAAQAATSSRHHSGSDASPASVGHDTLDDLLQKAFTALDQAKARGKNRVVW